ncbi:MAG TPA: hypothetical protein VNX15_05095 [Gemmatimonadales bacterium]|nr:hypothetical protein [Gemmatimonadales bacterium]
MRLPASIVSIPLVAACAPWAAGPRLTPSQSGIVGEWVPLAAPGSPDTTVFRFAADGLVTEMFIGAVGVIRSSPWGPYRIYGGSGARHLLCFAFRRSRSLPACRYFRVVPEPADAGRALELFAWVEQKDSVVEVWRERVAR